MFYKEFQLTILEYGLMNMALKLKERNFISMRKYRTLFRLNIEDKYKSIILVHLVVDNVKTGNKYLELKQFFSNDSGLWHLSMELHQLSMYVVYFQRHY